MFLGFLLVFMPVNYGLIVALHHRLGGVVGPLRAEDEDLAGLLHVLLVQVALLLGQDVGGKRLGDRGVHGTRIVHSTHGSPSSSHVVA